MTTPSHQSGEICCFHFWGMRAAVQDREVPDAGEKVQEQGL